MPIDADEEILQDFIVEAGEILEQLSEQLVDLENRPQDSDLLNAIFRGFHTVKGGSGFLNLTNLVSVCHLTENIFDLLRNGERSVTPELMDVVLQALDEINTMFEMVKQMEEPPAPDPDMMARLEQYCSPGGAEATPAHAPEPEAPAASGSDEITDEEFEGLLDQIHAKKAEAAPAKPAASGDEITDDEFESLLDELHGSGKSPTKTEADAKPAKAPAAPVGGDTITDDEFENLLDSLHGSGGSPTAATPASKPEPVEAKAAPAPEPKPAPAKPAAPAGSGAAKKPSAAAQAAGETTVRVDTKRLDDIMNMVGELVLVRNRLVMLGQNHSNEELAKTIQNLDVVTADLQGSVMKTRMQPIKKVFGRFPRVVRDLARNLKKEISLELKGEETDLDKNLVEALADPLVHLVRNSVDHGIEMPDEREAKKKPRTGKILLAAAQEGDHILLSIEDDGKGMDANMLRQKAVEKGLMDQDAADRLTENECYNLIFMPGFSTKDQISDISGRGVGMDVVKTKISQLNGSINVTSALGKGSLISIKVPLTLAILPTLMVTVGAQTFALPLASVNEIFHLDLTRTNNVDGQLTIIVRDKALPLFYLEEWLVSNGYGHTKKELGHVVIVQVGTQRVGFVVDSLLGQEEVVIKPLGQSLQGTPGMAGATITSDGGIALILDIAGLLKRYAVRR